MEESLIILLKFKDGIYPEIKQEAFKSKNTEISQIVSFFNNTISRANRYKEITGFYPLDIEDLTGWEDSQY